MKDDSNIKSFTETIWKTHISRNAEEFANLINDTSVSGKFFGKEYLDALSIKSREIGSLMIKLSLFYTLLMLSLFASIYVQQTEFEIMGYSFKNLSNYKEFLLFLAALISPISGVLGAYNNYLRTLIKECIKKEATNNSIHKFYSLQYLNNYLEGWTTSNVQEGNSFYNITSILRVILAIAIILLFIAVLVISFFIQINVIYDIIKNPSSTYYINLFVVGFALLSIIFSWIVTILQFPMPEKDYSNLTKLEEIKKNNPERYQVIISSISLKESKKDARFSLIVFAFIYMLIFSIVQVIWHPELFNNISLFIGKALIGAFLVMFFSSIILDFIFQRGRSWFFKKYPDDSSTRTIAYIKINKKFQKLKLITPAIITIVYILYI